MSTRHQNEKYIRQCFELATNGTGKVSPNPLVGAVIVKNEKVLATGYHQAYGEDHAERNAILKLIKNGIVKNCAAGSTIYVSLEPCNHFGKTPPCTDLIIEAGIKQVVFAVRDPNPKVAQNDSVKILKKAGIKVIYPVLEKEAKELNKVFFKNIAKQEPYYILKTAMSLDGKIATKTGESKWITSEKSRKFVQELRYAADAVLVGVNTVIKDDPQLTVRLSGKQKSIYRIVLDTNGRIPPESKLIKNNKDKKTILVVSENLTPLKINALKKLNVSLLLAPLDKKTGMMDLKKMSRLLFKLSICSVLIEGGSTIIDSFVRADLLDEYYCFIAPKIIGGKKAPTTVGGEGIASLQHAKKLKLQEIKKIGEDTLLHAYFK
jgi:diaminohydroxyphosphoribosylaminopyrimidine deaminase/5-amino-6-(5-phosphoribosylamino)uracil reductase